MARDVRQFLFVDLGLARMHAILNGAPTGESPFYGSDVWHEFMRAYPDYPVVRLALEPGEALLALEVRRLHRPPALVAAGRVRSALRC